MIFRDLIPYLFDLDDLIHNQKLCASVPSEARALTDGLCMGKDQGCQHIQVDGDSDPNFLLIVFGVVNFYCLEDKIVIGRFSSPLDHIGFFQFCSHMCLD